MTIEGSKFSSSPGLSNQPMDAELWRQLSKTDYACGELEGNSQTPGWEA